jgi:hypothetical protein
LLAPRQRSQPQRRHNRLYGSVDHSQQPGSDVSMSSKYSIPAILATVRGDALPSRSIIAPPSAGPV